MRVKILFPLFLVVILLSSASGVPPAFGASGPWIIVADSGDGSGTAVNLATGIPQIQPGIGSQVIGVATTGGTIAFSDFLGGAISTLQANPQGQFLAVGKGRIVTTPDNPSPEGMLLLGEGARALVSDGGSIPGGNPISLILVDLSNNQKLSELPLPSVYGAAYDSANRIAYVLDGVSMEVAIVAVGPGGALQDSGYRIALNGAAQLTRFIAIYSGGTRLLVSHKTDGAVEVLDVAGRTSLGRIEGLGSAIGAIAVSPDGTKAFVADFGGSKWAVLDLTSPGFPTDTGIRISVPGGVPNTFVGTRTFAFLGDRLYFSSTNGNVVSSINWKTLELAPETYATGAAPAGLDISF